MPRKPKFPPPIYPHKPSGTDRIRIWQNGLPTDISLGPSGSPEAREKYLRVCAELAAGNGLPLPQAGPLRLDELIARFWSHAEKKFRELDGSPKKELASYEQALKPLRRLYGSVAVNEFGPKALKAVQLAMASGTWRTAEERDAHVKAGKPLGMCRRVVNRHTTRIKTAFRWLESEELVPPATLHALETVGGLSEDEAVQYEEIPPVPEDDFYRTLPALHPVIQAMARFQLYTCARPGEVVKLRPMDFIRGGSVEVARGIRVKLGVTWAITPAQHKTKRLGSRRVILVGPKAQAAIAHLLSRAEDQYLFSPREVMTARLLSLDQTVNFGKSRPPGLHYTVGRYGKCIKKACERAGVPHWTPHQIRHLAATKLVQEFGWEIARLALGHKSVDTTRIYALDAYAKAVDAVGKVG